MRETCAWFLSSTSYDNIRSFYGCQHLRKWKDFESPQSETEVGLDRDVNLSSPSTDKQLRVGSLSQSEAIIHLGTLMHEIGLNHLWVSSNLNTHVTEAMYVDMQRLFIRIVCVVCLYC